MFARAIIVGAVGGDGFSALLDLSGPALGVISFALVLLVGVALLQFRPATVDRAVDLAADGTPLAIIYGIIAFGLVAFVGGYVFTQAARIATSVIVLQAAVGLVVLGAVALGGFGYAVLGALLTQLEGTRRPWPGAVIGAAISAAPWVVLPPLGAALVWLLLAAVGLGSVTKAWVHSDRPAESKLRG